MSFYTLPIRKLLVKARSTKAKPMKVVFGKVKQMGYSKSLLEMNIDNLKNYLR